jgi:hypothetical protein
MLLFRDVFLEEYSTNDTDNRQLPHMREAIPPFTPKAVNVD